MRAYRLNVYDDRTLEMVRARARARERARGGGAPRARAAVAVARARCRARSPPPPPSPAAARARSSRPRFTCLFRARAPRRAQINEATKQNFLKRIHYPSLSASQLYLGSRFTVLSRCLQIVAFADEGSRKWCEDIDLARARVRT